MKIETLLIILIVISNALSFVIGVAVKFTRQEKLLKKYKKLLFDIFSSFDMECFEDETENKTTRTDSKE